MLKVKIIGLEQLTKKLQADHLLGPPIKKAMQKSMLFVEGEARKGAKPHAVDTGELARSIKSSLGPEAVPLSAKVFTNKIYALPAEFGRKPGKMPPVDAIAGWVRRHGIGVPPFVIARAIGRRGTKGIFYMKKAAEAGQKKIPGFFKEAASAIEKIWGKK